MVLRDVILRLFALRDEDRLPACGLPDNHPLVRFVKAPDLLDHVLALDDTVLWGSLAMMVEAEDERIALRARQLGERRLLKCIDIWSEIAEHLATKGREETTARAERIARINLGCDRVIARAQEVPDAMIDDYKRDPYKRFQDSRTPPNQIHIMQDGKPRDMAELSSVVANAEPFRITRAYVTRGDTAAADRLRNIIRTSIDAPG